MCDSTFTCLGDCHDWQFKQKTSDSFFLIYSTQVNCEGPPREWYVVGCIFFLHYINVATNTNQISLFDLSDLDPK